MKRLTFLSVAMLMSGFAFSADALETRTLTLTEKGFSPAIINVPAGQGVKLAIENRTDAPMEFESGKLGREKVVKQHGIATISLNPLRPGEYGFVNDFHREIKGKIVAQ